MVIITNLYTELPPQGKDVADDVSRLPKRASPGRSGMGEAACPGAAHGPAWAAAVEVTVYSRTISVSPHLLISLSPHLLISLYPYRWAHLKEPMTFVRSLAAFKDVSEPAIEAVAWSMTLYEPSRNSPIATTGEAGRAPIYHPFTPHSALRVPSFNLHLPPFKPLLTDRWCQYRGIPAQTWPAQGD
jgi:hypothetical protein